MRKKLTVLLVVLAAGVFAAVAWAATPQGQLLGHSGENITDGVIEKVSVDGAVKDGQTDPLYIGKANDGSGNCTGDTGTVFVKYKAAPNVHTVPIICAHWLAAPVPGGPCNRSGDLGSRTGCQSMVFDFKDPVRADTWVVVRAISLGVGAHDETRASIYSSAATAQDVVNVGTANAGQGQNGLTFVDNKAQWAITATQT